MTDSLAERARLSRNSGAVLKARLSNIRSRNRSVPILIFEGDTDLGPYEAWITRIRDDLEYEPLPGKGKAQVLNLRERLSRDSGGLSAGVYFLLDRDFDGLREQGPGPDIFCTECYSIENYLVCGQVLRSLITDEFRCAAECEERDRVLAAFADVANQFASCMYAANRRLYAAKVLGLSGDRIAGSIADYVSINLDAVSRNASDADLERLIPLSREPTEAELLALGPAFDAFDPMERYRGKFVLAFFLRWLDLLANARREGNAAYFSEAKSIGFSSGQLSLRSLATRSRISPSLRAFVQSIAAVPQPFT